MIFKYCVSHHNPTSLLLERYRPCLLLRSTNVFRRALQKSQRTCTIAIHIQTSLAHGTLLMLSFVCVAQRGYAWQSYSNSFASLAGPCISARGAGMHSLYVAKRRTSASTFASTRCHMQSRPGTMRQRATVRGSGYTLLKDLLVRHNSLGICVEKMFAMLAVMNM